MEFKKISSLATKVWNMSAIITIIVHGILSIALYIGLNKLTPLSEKLIILISCIPIIFIAYYIIKVFVLIKILYENWYFSIGNDVIVLKYGVIFKSTVYIPVSRIQHISTSQGPILKKYGLREITVNTAGGSHSIPCLEEENAYKIQEAISISAERSQVKNGL